MANNSSRENSPTKSNTPERNDDAVPVTPTPTPTPVPVPVRTLQFGEGSSAVPPTVQELVEGFSSSSSSSSSSSNTTPPRRVVQLVIGGRGEGSPKRKRRALASSGKKDGGDETQGVEKKRKKGEMDAPKSEPICSLCGKKFGSWKGVFGHLRAHPERDWRGAFPPPKGEAAGSWSPIKIGGPDDHQALQVQLLAPTLLDLARETLAKMRQESTTGAAVRNIDLNKEPGSSSSPSPPPPQGGGGASGSGSGGLDLNKSPPESDQEGNNGKKE